MTISSALGRRLRQEECCELKPPVVGRMSLSQRKEKRGRSEEGEREKKRVNISTLSSHEFLGILQKYIFVFFCFGFETESDSTFEIEQELPM